jgi:choice-of-anchor A domain-containing protein
MIRSAFATLGVLLLSIAVHAAPIDLGYAADYNVFTFGNLGEKGNFHIVGRTAVGGNVHGSFTFGDPAYNTEWKAAASTSYFTYIGGTNDAPLNVVGPGDAFIHQPGTERVNPPNASYAVYSDQQPNSYHYQTPPAGAGHASILFDKAKAYLTGLSQTIGNLKNIGGAVISGDDVSGYTLTANAPVTVFNMSQKQFENLYKISVPDSYTLLINVEGNVISRGTAHDMKINDDGNVNTVRSGNILFNFQNATSISTGNTIYGSILAPLATLNGNQNLKGQIIVDTLASSGEIHAAKFTGEFPPVSTPEPSTMLLMGSGLLGIWNLRKRMFRG